MHILVSGNASRWKDLQCHKRARASHRYLLCFWSKENRRCQMQELPVLDEHAAFVDVGSEHMHVSIAGGQPKVFGTVTSQLEALRDWLEGEGVKAVAMEATEGSIGCHFTVSWKQQAWQW